MSSPKLSLVIKIASCLFAAASLTAFAPGCAADANSDEADADAGDEVSSEDALRASSSIEPGSFKLYSTAHANPNPGCDVHTALSLSKERGVSKANLREVVGGFCELYVAPDAREYRLKFEGTSCGSKIFSGKKRINGKTREITITDHRSRICRDLVPAEVIVEETAANGGAKQMKYSLDFVPQPATPTWLTIAPRQCGTNPWNGAQVAPGQDASWLGGEAGEVDNFFRGKGIKLEQVGFGHPSEPMMVCMACQCPRGDTLIVHAKSSADAKKLVDQFGFAPMAADARVKSPTQCGSNPWEANASSGSSNETELFTSWAKANGAPLKAAAFVDYTEPRVVCAACQCPRGDLAIAFPKDASSVSKLENLGFQRVEN
jgi:hypothetical protein